MKRTLLTGVIILLFSAIYAKAVDDRPIKAQCPFEVSAISLFYKLENHYPATILPSVAIISDDEELDIKYREPYLHLEMHVEWRDFNGASFPEFGEPPVIARCTPGPFPKKGEKFSNNDTFIDIPRDVEYCISDHDKETKLGKFVCY